MATRRVIQMESVDRLKSMLPVAGYLHLLHQGAMTGFLPRFSPDGRPTGQFDNLAPRDRMDIARYLLDKVLPDAPKELALTTTALPPDDELSPTVLRHLTTDELRRIATPASQDALPDVQTPIETAPVFVPLSGSEHPSGAAAREVAGDDPARAGAA
jgi:hypothetical protein